MVREINPVVDLLERQRLQWQKSSRILEVDSVGEKFLEIETMVGGSPYEKGIVEDSSFPMVAGDCGTARN